MEEFLYPRPEDIESLPGASPLPTEASIRVDEPEGDRVLARWRERLGGSTDLVRVDANADWRLGIDAGPDPERYAFTWSESGVEVTAGGAAGLFYALTTFAQWIDLQGGWRNPIRHVRIVDRPSFRHRGVLLDISRDKVPTLETLRALIDRLASWKVNQVQLYTEHTFAYAGHEIIWADASPLTASEIRALDAYAADRFIELVPNQNSLGHFHRWLIHEPYRRLAECPEGLEHPFSSAREPFSLCPTDPAALELLADLYDQLLPNFASRQLNVGLDESFDIGRGRSARAVRERGAGRIYLDFVHEVARLAQEREHRIQLWGDIILGHPELVAELPEEVVVLNWGYEADHPFADEAARFADAGRDFYVCPGTSSWNSFTGRTTNAIENLANAARSGRATDASGLLITDWGDYGHWQPLAVSYPGLLAGACFAWHAASADASADFDIATGLDRHLYRDASADGLGSIGAQLGDVYLEAGGRPKNGTPPFFALFFPRTPLDHSRFDGCTVAGLRRASELYAEAAAALASDVGQPAEASSVRRELAWAADLARLGSDLLAERIELGVDAARLENRRDYGHRLHELVERQPEIWLERNRPGGRERSLARLEEVRLELLG